jgi:hypothetical protein
MKAVLWATVLLCVTSRFAVAQSSDAESKVFALERLWGEAAQLRDTRALESIFDDSIAYVHIDGRLMTKSQVLEDTKAVNPVNIVVDSPRARSHGKLVIVTGVMQLKGMECGKPYVRYGRFLDTWLYKGDHWVCVSSMTTALDR